MKLKDIVRVISDMRYHVDVYSKDYMQYAQFDVDYSKNSKEFSDAAQKESLFLDAEVVHVNYSNAYKAICVSCQMDGNLPVFDSRLINVQKL